MSSISLENFNHCIFLIIYGEKFYKITMIEIF
jgi:hypothetical protein